jgi:hypothetical protein
VLERLSVIDEKLNNHPDEIAIEDILWLREQLRVVTNQLQRYQLQEFHQVQQLRRAYQNNSDYLPETDEDSDDRF